MREIVSRQRKRLFLLLIFFSFWLVCFAAYGTWVLISPGLSNINRFLPTLSGVLFAVSCLVLAGGVIGIVLTIMGVSLAKMFQRLAWSSVNILFPLALMLGKIFKIDKERIERSFIALSNYLIHKKGLKILAEKLLILSPHCIQKESCPHKVTSSVLNCRRCGACQVGDLVHISEAFGAKLVIVTGGTLARRVIKNMRPHAVLAIACERDLTSGIQDIFPLPVIGILNERPFGPCANTKVDLENVKAAIETLCGTSSK
jgi:hypothetical protein